MLKLIITSLLLSMLFLCSCATKDAVAYKLPTEVSFNADAGRGGWLIVNLRLENGKDLPFIVDTGTGDTCFDKSLAAKLGQSLGATTVQRWGHKTQENIYAMPKLYLGGTALISDGQVVTYDLQSLIGQQEHPVMGVLGHDMLRHYCIQLDFAANKMRFLDDRRADKSKWGNAFPIMALNAKDGRPAVAENLLGMHGPHSLIDSGCNFDGWLMKEHYQQWTNKMGSPTNGEARSPDAGFGGEKYPFVSVSMEDVESDGIGLHFPARHLVTLDFPKETLYLRRQSIGPLPDPHLKTTRMKGLDSLIMDVLQNDLKATQQELARIEQSEASNRKKEIARNLAATLINGTKLIPAEIPPKISRLPLGDASPDSAEVGWLTPTANRIPPNAEIESPLLDSGKIYATGLFAHSPSRYVYNLGGRWRSLRGEAGLHTAFQPYAYGVVFVIKADGREVFHSSVIHGPDHARYDVDVTGVKTLELLVNKTEIENGGDWGLWLEPTLFRE